MSTKNLIIGLLGACLLAAAILVAFVMRDPESGQQDPLSPVEDDASATPIAPRTSKPGPPEPATPGTAETDPAPTEQRFETVLRAAWGGQPGQIGRKRAEESAPEGPMSFAVDDDGRLWVLDQVNARIQLLKPDGEPTTFPVGSETFQDLALDAKDRPVLMDRLVKEAVVSLDDKGAVRAEAPLVGEGIPEGGGTTGMFVRPDGIWVEWEHRYVVRVADADGNPVSPRLVLPGRFSADGQFLLTAALDGNDAALVLVRPPVPEATGRLLGRVGFPLPVLNLNLLESDMASRVYLGAVLARIRPTEPFDVLETFQTIVILSPEGAELARLHLPVSPLAEEQFRSLFVTPDGVIYQLWMDESGVELRRIVP